MAVRALRVAFLMADYGHDPTEAAIPYAAFVKAGFAIDFVTGSGSSPVCDKRMLEGWTQKLLGADAAAVSAYDSMSKSKAWQNALSWSDMSFDLKAYDVVFLPGGHDKAVRQILDSSRAQALLAEYFPLTKKPSDKICAAICHGVQVLAHSKLPNGKSLLHNVSTTALPGLFESFAYQSTRLMLGDYYKTYGAGSENVEDIVKKGLDDPRRQWQTSANPGSSFVVKDEVYNYLSGRWPGDAQALADQVVSLLKK